MFGAFGCQLLTGSNDGYFHLQIMWIDEALIANTQNKIKNSKKEVYISTWFVGKETTL